jgi:predicted XRE-type DNA-binding protein
MNEKLELIKGNGNVFRDLGMPDADTEQMKAELAAKIIGTLNARQLTNMAASRLSGVQEADISRIRNADLRRFTIDRLVKILNGLGYRVSVNVSPRSLELA